MPQNEFLLGLDMGGTKMLAMVMDSKFKPVGRAKKKTPPGGDHDVLLKSIVATIRSAAKDAGIEMDAIRALGVAVPGPLNREEGRVIEMVNVGMRDYPLRDRLQDELKVPVDLENDVNAGTYGEFIAGSAVGYKNVVGVFPGTGVGGGIVIDGKLYRGRLGRAAEIGHMIVQVGGPLCGCGHHGCLEAVSSKTAIAKDLVHLAAVGLAPTILSKAGTDFKAMKSALIKKSIDAGEQAVIDVVDRAAWYLGVGLANCVNIFDPDILVVGGGLVEKLGDDYMEKVRKSTIENSMVPTEIPIVASTLGDESVVVGAATLAAEEAANG